MIEDHLAKIKTLTLQNIRKKTVLESNPVRTTENKPQEIINKSICMEQTSFMAC